jgi:CDP-diacylglycerol--glycerol-3-phosphate 3-phosphatidyltransferase
MRRGMTTANKVTIVRIFIIPLFIVEVLYYYRTTQEWHRYAALICFFVASVLDGVDGYIARRYNQRSELGAILDPLADKLLLVSGVVLLSLRSPAELEMVPIPLWVTATILSRDVLMVIGLVVIQMVCGKAVVRPRILGKIATVLQMITVLWTLLKWSRGWLAFWSPATAVCTGIAGLFYVYDGVRQLSDSPKSLPIRNGGQ